MDLNGSDNRIDLINISSTIERVGPQPTPGNEIWICKTTDFANNIIDRDLVLSIQKTIPYIVIDGNHRLTVFNKMGIKKWPCLLLHPMYV